MNIDNLTTKQIISLAILKGRYADYIKLLDYDAIDWMEWTKIHRN